MPFFAWEGLSVEALTPDAIFPCLFITIACGAISGFHATQSPLMARCMKSEKQGRPIFYGAMITEGIVALIWATVAMYFFYNQPTPGYEMMEGGKDIINKAPSIVSIICDNWLGLFGSILAILGVVAAPITSGDTALRSCRLIIADFIHLEQRSIRKRLYVWFGWSNQTLSVFMLWAITVYLVQQKKPYIITLVPALFMTVVCVTYLFSAQLFKLDGTISAIIAAATLLVALVWFVVWHRKVTNLTNK